MLNALEIIRSDVTAKKFEIGGLLFAQFTCPVIENETPIWAQTDHLLHVLSGKTSWKTSTGTHFAEAGETVFFRKGAYIMPQYFAQDICIEIFFIPDAFIKKTVLELAPDLPDSAYAVESNDLMIRVKNDLGLSAFFQAMGVYFVGNETPPEMLLKLKFKELIANLIIGQSNPVLSAYLRSVADSDAPAIPAIMEMNFQHNLSIEEFARLCHRSVSTFKREFQKHYGTSPGKWLLERRIQHAALLLKTTGMNVTQIALECGFEELSHFSRTFKEQFGKSPAIYRETSSI